MAKPRKPTLPLSPSCLLDRQVTPRYRRQFVAATRPQGSGEGEPQEGDPIGRSTPRADSAMARVGDRLAIGPRHWFPVKAGGFPADKKPAGWLAKSLIEWRSTGG